MGNFALPLVSDSYGARGSADSDRDARFQHRRSRTRQACYTRRESLTCPSPRESGAPKAASEPGWVAGGLPIQLPVSATKSGALDTTLCASATP